MKNDAKLRKKCVVLMQRSKKVEDYVRCCEADAGRESRRKELNELNKSSRAEAAKEINRTVVSRKVETDKEGITQAKNGRRPDKSIPPNDKAQFYNTLLEEQRERLRRRAEERRRQHSANEARRDEERRKQRFFQDKLYAENVLLQQKQLKARLEARRAEEKKKSQQTVKRHEELKEQEEMVRQRVLEMQALARKLESQNAALNEQKSQLLHSLGSIQNAKIVAEPNKLPKSPKSRAVTKETTSKEATRKRPSTPMEQPASTVDISAKPEEQLVKSAAQLSEQAAQVTEHVAQLTERAAQRVKSAVQPVKPAEQPANTAVQPVKPAEQLAKRRDQPAKPAKHKRIAGENALRNAMISSKEAPTLPQELMPAAPIPSRVEFITATLPPVTVTPMKRLRVRLKRMNVNNLASGETVPLEVAAEPPQPALPIVTPEPLPTAPAVNADESPNNAEPAPTLASEITSEQGSLRVLWCIDSDTPTLDEFELSGRVDKQSQVDMDVELTKPAANVGKCSGLVQPTEAPDVVLTELQSQTRQKAGEARTRLREQLLGMAIPTREPEQIVHKNAEEASHEVINESSFNVEEKSQAKHSKKLSAKHKKLKYKSRKRLGARNNGQEKGASHEVQYTQQEQEVLVEDRGPTPLLDEISPPDACVFSVEVESEALPLLARNPIEISNEIAAAASGLTLLANGLAPAPLPSPPAQQVNLIEHSVIALPTPPEPPDVDANHDSPAFPSSLVALPQSSELPPMVEDQQSAYDFDYLSATQQLPAAIERYVVELKTVNNIMKDSTIALLNFEATPTVPAYLFNGESRDVPTPSPTPTSTPTPTPTSAAELANSAVQPSVQEQEVSVDSSVSVSLPASSTVCLALSTSDHEVSSTQETIYELPKRLVTVKPAEPAPASQDSTTMLVQNNQVDTTHHVPESSHSTRRRQYKNNEELDESVHLSKRRKTFCAESTLSPAAQAATSSGSSPSTTTATMEKPPTRRRGGRAAKNTAATQQMQLSANATPRQRLLRSISSSTPPPASDGTTARGNCDSPGELLPALSAAHIKRTYSKNSVVQKVFVPPEIEECLDSEADTGELVETTSTCNMPDTVGALEQRKCRATPVHGSEGSVGRKRQKTTSIRNVVLRKPSSAKSVKSAGGQRRRK